LPDIASFGLYMVVFLFSLSLHEAAHAWTAERFGDRTGRQLGRVTLNPLPHIDLFGTLIFPAIGFFTGATMFGWAKPVPWNSRNVKDYRRASIWIAAAGPISNILVLVVFVILLKVFHAYLLTGGVVRGTALEPLYQMCMFGAQLNIALAVFNLIPIPPLDGSWILPQFLPYTLARSYEQLRPYGFFMLIVCLYLGVFTVVLTPFWSLLRAIIYS
jgi:Zn-dependent protease